MSYIRILVSLKLEMKLYYLQQHCWTHLFLEITGSLFFTLFLQISNSSDSECSPKLFVISSKVRIGNQRFSSALNTRRLWGGSEKLLNVDLLQLLHCVDRSHSHLWSVTCTCGAQAHYAADTWHRFTLSRPFPIMCWHGTIDVYLHVV